MNIEISGGITMRQDKNLGKEYHQNFIVSGKIISKESKTDNLPNGLIIFESDNGYTLIVVNTNNPAKKNLKRYNDPVYLYDAEYMDSGKENISNAGYVDEFSLTYNENNLIH